MSILVTCAQCQKILKAPDNAAGKKARCPHCETVMVVAPPVAANTETQVKPAPPVNATQPAKTPPPPIPTVAKQRRRANSTKSAANHSSRNNPPPLPANSCRASQHPLNRPLRFCQRTMRILNLVFSTSCQKFRPQNCPPLRATCSQQIYLISHRCRSATRQPLRSTI